MTVYVRLTLFTEGACLWLNMQQVWENVLLNVAAKADFSCFWRSVSGEKCQTKTGGKIKRVLNEVSKRLRTLTSYFRYLCFFFCMWDAINYKFKFDLSKLIKQELVSPTHMGMFQPKYFKKDKTLKVETSWLLVLLISIFLGQVWQLSVMYTIFSLETKISNNPPENL